MNVIVNIDQRQSLQSLAPVEYIETEAQYAQTTELLNSLLDVVRDNVEHPLYSFVSVVGDLLEAYEIEHNL